MRAAADTGRPALRPTSGLQALSGAALLLLLAACGAALAALESERMLAGEMQRTVEDFRKSLMQVANRLPEDESMAAELRRMMRTTRLRGIEIFSPQGRRVWSAGEPLEIVGYPLDQRRAVTHATADGSRFESYWHAELLQSRHGLALRLDRDWQQPVRRRMRTASLIVVATLVAAAAGIGLWTGKTLYGRRMPGNADPSGKGPHLRWREEP